jgi:hypothetical protein
MYTDFVQGKGLLLILSFESCNHTALQQSTLQAVTHELHSALSPPSLQACTDTCIANAIAALLHVAARSGPRYCWCY